MITVEQIHTIISNVVPKINVNKINPYIPLREYGLDSIDFFSIIIELQELLGNEIPDEDIDQIQTVADIQEYFSNQKS